MDYDPERDELYEKGQMTDQHGATHDRAQIRTQVTGPATATYPAGLPIAVWTSWQDDVPGVAIMVMPTEGIGALMLAPDVDGRQRANLEAEHRRVVDTVRSGGMAAVRPFAS